MTTKIQKLNSNIRRPLTGNLQISILAVKDVDHIVGARPIRGPDSLTFRSRLKTRYELIPVMYATHRWNEEFNISVDKANEIEIAIYDKVNDQNIPVGLMWLRISDIAEAIRRRRVEQESESDRLGECVEGSRQRHHVSGRQRCRQRLSTRHIQRVLTRTQHNNRQRLQPHASPLVFTIHLTLQLIRGPSRSRPARFHLALNFEKASRGTKRPYDGIGGLGRQGAIRQKKEEVHEMHGHQFVQHQFYNVMKCAYCGDFLKYAGGYQCMDFKYTCHKKCYPNVVTKCISRASNEVDPDEEKLNHRIPHRFEPYTNMGANWCCHCGYLLPLGKKNVQSAQSVGSTCHASCVHLVPDFCGMSNEVANKILREIKKTKHRKAASVGSIETGRPRVQLCITPI